jgi:hypothetical protein
MMVQAGVRIEGEQAEDGLEQVEDSFGDARRSSNRICCYCHYLNTEVI